jgi:hypothetical protein
MTRAIASAALRRAPRELAILTLSAALVAGCDGGGGSARVRIDLDVPEEDAMGALLGDIDALEFRVSDGQEFVSGQLQQIADGLPGELRLPDVPTGDDILFDLSGLDGDAVLAYGRTCRLLVAAQDQEISALLYFSRVGRFRAGDPPLEPARSSGLMFADDRGRAIVTGGSQDDQVVELFDPRVGSFSPQGEAVPRLGGAIAVRADGTAVIAGGMDAAGVPVGVVEQFNPGSQAEDERIVQLGPERQAEAERTGLGLAALADGGVLLTGGRTATGSISDGVALLAGGDDQFRPVAALTRSRAGHTTSVGLGGVAYMIGGLSVDQTAGTEVVTGSIELYRPEDTGVRLVSAELAVPRFGHTATVLDDGRILVVGGKTPREGGCAADTAVVDCIDAVQQVELFDPIVDEVRAIDSTNFGAVYDHTATLLTGGRVLITGGVDASGNPRADAWLFDPGLEALVPTRAMSRARARHSATELCDGTVLLVGGDTDDGEAPPSERYSPASTRPP